ncbi:hypothetical protein C477_13985 [Haloterrigena salina JCM 13891]|uniref:Uncharacterized protein n=1 Tax=Haloterrigena salina JCM 13891 TaxID=1227488 RepID=M0C232_9EURY|nr:hypothetical protein [Haloterrigena salina]ELZ17346.1 hypothetical protein C477_13985 [Haloterrigena salina JCM 13891]
MTLAELIRDERINAIIGWLLVSIVALGGLENVFTGILLWGGFELLIVVAVAAPALTTGDWTAVVSWPLLAVVAFAAVAGAAVFPFETSVYITVATLALIVVVELEAFTAVELSRRFSVGFAVLTTMALQALWTVAQFYADRWLGTEYLRSQTELQWDFVVVTVVGLALGGIFQWYVVRFQPAGAVDRAANGADSL